MAISIEKSYRKIKRSYTWLSLVGFVIVSILSFAIVYGIIGLFILYSINSKVDNRYELVKSIVLVYEKALESQDTSLFDEIRSDYPDCVIIDKKGGVFSVYGINTRGGNGGALGYLFSGRDYLVYEDTDEKYLYYRSGLFMLDMFKILKRSNVLLGANLQDNEDESDVFDIDGSKVVEMPVWIGTKLSDGKLFVAKVPVRIRVLDVVILTGITVGITVIMLIIMIIRLIGIIGGILTKKRLTNLFLTDEVTGSDNWMAFKLKGERLLKNGKNLMKRYAMIHLVIVKYRNYCMCHSMEEGQMVLRKVSDILKQNLLKRKELCAHVGTSSFVLLLEAENADAIRTRYFNMLTLLKYVDAGAEGTQQPGHSDAFHIFNFQAGVSVIEPSFVGGKKKKRKDANIEQCYNNAVTAKATLETTDDDGIAFFDNKLMEDEQWISKVEENQRKALVNEEFVVYYQPKYSPGEGELIGAEALIRWQSPDFGFVPPGRFIPVFEKNGFITDIDHYMILHVARDQKNWLDAGMKCVPVSVNVSRAHFAEKDLAEQIKNMVDSVGTPHEFIEIELTESAFFDDKEAIIETIERLKSYGFSVSMDDFGSGYSSLNSLKDMDLDVLKLDAEFFRGNADPKRKEAVVSEAIRLAKRLNMRTVAEGVEDKEQVDFLEKIGCDMIQGYYFAKPMPKNDYEERMREVYHKPEGFEK